MIKGLLAITLLFAGVQAQAEVEAKGPVVREVLGQKIATVYRFKADAETCIAHLVKDKRKPGKFVCNVGVHPMVTLQGVQFEKSLVTDQKRTELCNLFIESTRHGYRVAVLLKDSSRPRKYAQYCIRNAFNDGWAHLRLASQFEEIYRR